MADEKDEKKTSESKPVTRRTRTKAVKEENGDTAEKKPRTVRKTRAKAEAQEAVEKDVTPTIEIVDGKVVVSLDATAKTGYKVMLNVYQKASLTAQWPTEPTKSYELDSAAEAVGFDPSAGGSGFYKVGVTIEDAE